MDSPNLRLVSRFYEAFQALDAQEMCACYAKDIVFHDPAFGELRGDRARYMWHMLSDSQRGKGFVLNYGNMREEGDRVRADWEAQYIFSRTGRKVHNKIEAEMVIENGVIVQHTDRFNLHRWATQATGFSGWALGWSAFYQGKLQVQTNRILDNYMRKHN